MDLAISALDGTIQMPGANPEAGFRSVWLDASYRREANLVSIGAIQIKLDDDRHFSFSGDLLDFHSDQPVVAGSLGNRLSLSSSISIGRTPPRRTSKKLFLTISREVP